MCRPNTEAGDRNGGKQSPSLHPDEIATARFFAATSNI
jgi:hypothetical protein